MRSILDERDLAAISGRVGSLTPSSSPRWGHMSVDAMLAHLCLSAQMALGELPVAPKGPRVFRVFPLKHLVLYVLPFPKSAPTAPELLAAQPGSFEAARTRMLELFQRVAAGPKAGPGPSHPLFGPLTRQEWGVLGYKHTDHHLRQFGV
jgi:hypothetical protein